MYPEQDIDVVVRFMPCEDYDGNPNDLDRLLHENGIQP